MSINLADVEQILLGALEKDKWDGSQPVKSGLRFLDSSVRVLFSDDDAFEAPDIYVEAGPVDDENDLPPGVVGALVWRVVSLHGALYEAAVTLRRSPAVKYRGIKTISVVLSFYEIPTEVSV